ncbi:alpha/beta fold hydrolase [Hydrogenophaga sp. BPS33]|uniref:alpha/beta fold hydrolase n=1 Tax=Hydrogenophaga sp. BPS33 TaxID=2651974 RepID=UPI00131FB396|nr:alpha/beta fold hydrolase [Hydrogenophaga sp. BPS33]QHE85932.1 alpha/beta fold hydrolase [Hydrogenophaga sp. BPS33]
MSEILVVFGSDRHLAGTLNLPEGGETEPVGVLLYNAGVISRMGPHRLNVKLARDLSARGVASLRFDLSGQGDSRVCAQGHTFERQAVLDLQAAMDHMERICNIKHFVVGGICSGAHTGLAVADIDPRVVGLWMVDGHAYPTLKSLWRRRIPQLTRRPLQTLLQWSKSLVGLALFPLRRLMRRQNRHLAVLDMGRETPSKEAFANTMQTIVDRGVDVFMVYTASVWWTYNYAGQWRDSFKDRAFVDQVRCEHLPEMDHTATRLSSQRWLIDNLGKWVDNICDRPQHTVW